VSTPIAVVDNVWHVGCLGVGAVVGDDVEHLFAHREARALATGAKGRAMVDAAVAWTAAQVEGMLTSGT